MKFNNLYNFISPVTGRILADLNYVLVGNNKGIAIPSPALIDLRLDLINLRHDYNITKEASFVIGTPNSQLSNAQVLNSLDNGVMLNINGTVNTISVNNPICYAASTSNIIATYDNGNEGVGATLTLVESGVFNIDGVLPPIGSFILIKNQISNQHNGIYTYTSNLPFITLTRSVSYDSPIDINQGDSVTVRWGNSNELSTWVQTEVVNIVGVDDILYIGPMGLQGPQGPQGPTGPQGPQGPSGSGGSGESAAGNFFGDLFGGLANGIGQGVGSAIVSALKDTAFGAISLGVSGASLGVSIAALVTGAAGTSGIPTLNFVSNLNLNKARIKNIAQSPVGDFDAISARWVWDLLNDNVEIKWEQF